MLSAGFSRQSGPDEDAADVPEDESSLASELRDIGYVLWIEDGYEYVRYLFSRHETTTPELDEDEWIPAPTAVPFGPFMVIGFIITILVGEPLTAMYLAFAIPKAISGGVPAP